MKVFFAGVLATFVGGLLLFFAQDRYTSWKKGNEKSITVRIDNETATLTPANIKEILKQDPDSIRFATVSVKNSGDKTLINSDIKFVSDISKNVKIYGSGIVGDVGVPDDAFLIQSVSGGFRARVSAIEPGKAQRFWIAYSCCQIFSAHPLSQDLSITQSNSLYDSPSDSTLWWFGGAFILIIVFFGGAAVNGQFTQSELKKRGINLQQSLKMPVIQDEENNA